MARNFWFIFMIGLLGNFVANNPTNCCTSTRAGQSAAQHIAHHTTQNGTGGGALFLLGHAGAAAQTHGRYQQYGRQGGVKTSIQFHGKFLQINNKNQNVPGITTVTGEVPLLVACGGASVRLRTECLLFPGWRRVCQSNYCYINRSYIASGD